MVVLTVSRLVNHTDDPGAFTINIGQRPTLVSVENQFGVIGEGPIPTGDEMRKRSWRQALLSDFNCPAGQSMCPVGFKGRFQCVNVASNVEGESWSEIEY